MLVDANILVFAVNTAAPEHRAGGRVARGAP